MKLHTVFITYNRLDLTKQAIQSYLDTVSVPFTFMVVDNGSTDGTVEWLLERLGRYSVFPAEENKYPGWAANMGWGFAPDDADVLHRADNDHAFLPGWCEHIERMLKTKKIGQIGLRTDEEESFAKYNVGGNCVIRRELWDKGLRYDERPWPEYPPGYSEDSFMSPAVEDMGYTWRRVGKPCIVSLAVEDPHDPYYRESWSNRNILEHSLARYGVLPNE